MIPKLIFICTLAFMTVTCIQIPLKQGEFKCMLVYAVGHQETIKIDIDFPYFSSYQPYDHYFVSLRNTQTHQVQKQQRSPGRFRRQISVHQQIIYELCFEIVSPHEIIGELLIDYNADTYHMADKNSIKIPDSLLKVENIQEIYRNSYMLNQMSENYKKIQYDWNAREQMDFEETQKSESRISAISVLQILLILCITIIQGRLVVKKIKEDDSPLFSML